MYSVDEANEAGATALHYAAENRYHASVTYLAGIMVKYGAQGANPKMIYAWDGLNISKAKAEFEKEKPADAKLKLADWTPLHVAVSKGDVKSVKSLVEAGADPDIPKRDEQTPLMIAAQHDNSSVVEWLLEQGSVIAQRPMQDRDEVTVHRIAAEAGAEASLKLLITNMGVKSFPLDTLVWSAVEHMQFDCAALMLEEDGKGDIVHPDTKVPLSAYYEAILAKYAQAFPHSYRRSERLETLIFKKPPDEQFADPQKPSPETPSSEKLQTKTPKPSQTDGTLAL